MKAMLKQYVVKRDDGRVEPANKNHTGDFMIVDEAGSLSVLFGTTIHPQDNTRYIDQTSHAKFAEEYTIFGKDKKSGAPIYAERESFEEAVGRHFQNKKARNVDPVRTAALASIYELYPEMFANNPKLADLVKDYLDRERRATAATTHGVGVFDFEL